MECGLLGQKLGHSYSPQIHRLLGPYPYRLFEKEPQALEDFLRRGRFTGLNVTIPYKKAVIAYLDRLTPEAARLGAVNTIVRQSDGALVGHNTDYFGFRSMVEQSGANFAGKKVLVLGSGGASNTVVAVLRELGAQAVVISRHGENNYQNLHRHADAAGIVNATPVGMYPNNGISPVDLDLFHSLECVLDIVYNPARTRLILEAQERKIPAMSGLWMLVAQAKESSEWFQGKTLSDDVIGQICRRLRREMENIILIGMPGSGKTTLAAALAARLGRPWADADAQIEAAAGCPIPQIFAQQGQAGFRKLESQVLRELGKQSGLVIATGGGCVTRAENYPALHQNGTIFWLTRDLRKLPTQGRPLSQTGDLAQMYQVRAPLYRRFADHIIDNDGPLDQTLARIIQCLEECV